MKSGVSTPNIFASKPEDVSLPFYKTGAKSKDFSRPGFLIKHKVSQIVQRLSADNVTFLSCTNTIIQ